MHGEDEPTPCVGNSAPYDFLIDHDTGSAGLLYMVDQAWRMCDGCDIRLWCHTRNENEPWLKQMRKYHGVIKARQAARERLARLTAPTHPDDNDYLEDAAL